MEGIYLLSKGTQLGELIIGVLTDEVVANIAVSSVETTMKELNCSKISRESLRLFPGYFRYAKIALA